MSVLRQQFLRQVAVTAAAADVTPVDIFGPESPLETPFAEGTDHVVRERAARQNEAGWVTIDGWRASALAVPALLVDVEIWSRGSASAQRGMSAPYYPTGAAAAADPVLKRVVASGVAGDSAALLAIFGVGYSGVATSTSTKNVPALHVRADEFVRLRLTNPGGALGPVTLSAKYDLGHHPADNQNS